MDVIWLDNPAAEHRAQVGNKAATLSVLRRAGLPVPNGFCVPLHAAEEDPRALWPAIAKAYAELAPGGGAVVVRSSGIAEDSAGASFAGQYETILNVRGIGALRPAVERCWASIGSARARAYQDHHGQGDHLLPVLVQQQVPAAVSGVLFTMDPMSGYGGETLIEAAPGLGERLMSGRVPPSQYRVDRQGHVRALSPDPTLTPAQCRTLARLAEQVERVLGRGQDIEWAMVEDRAYVLQARPITCKAAPLPLSKVWTRANIGEVLPHAVTPLTWAVFRATLLHDPGLMWSAPGEDDENGEEGLRRVHGHAYIRLDGLLHSFCYLPAVTPAVMRLVLGVDLPPLVESYTPPGGWPVRLAQIAFVADALGFLPRLKWMVRRLPPLPAASAPRVRQIQDRLAEVVRWTANCFRLHLKCTAYAIAAFGLAYHLLARWLPSEVEALLPQILIGHEDLQTAVQGLSLWQLADQVRGNQALLKALGEASDWPAMTRRLAGITGGPAFLEAIESFLAANGARTAGEFELAVPRWSQDPSFLLDVLLKFVHAQPAGAVGGDYAARRRRRQEGIARAYAALRPGQRWLLARLLASYSDYTTWRENVKYRLMEGYALLRQIFVQVGDDLEATGVLEKTSDVFFLQPAEILALAEGRMPAAQVPGLIQARRERHARWTSQAVPDLIVDNGQGIASSQAGDLVGIGCSPGAAEGLARVLLDPADADALRPGEILVAPHTDPGWTPLFLSCRAVVTEVGGFLSHGATVAREYGIPAIVNVKGATSEIRTGDLVRVDGTSGRITFLQAGRGDAE